MRRAGPTLLVLLLPGCLTPEESRMEVQSDSLDQVWKAEPSQVSLREAQSRVFEGRDRMTVLAGIVEVMQDLGFTIEVLDEALGIVSGKRFLPFRSTSPGGSRARDPSYHLYTDDCLLSFGRTFRTMGPFWHREDLVRLTVTLRPRGSGQLVVRANAQYFLRPLEDPEPYRRFFDALEQHLRGRGALGRVTDPGRSSRGRARSLRSPTAWESSPGAADVEPPRARAGSSPPSSSAVSAAGCGPRRSSPAVRS